jgi:hypothetical protein
VYTLVAKAVSFSEFAALTADLSTREVAEETRAPQQDFASRVEAFEGGLADIKGQQAWMLERQQQQLPDVVPALARHVVRSPLECATSNFERTGSTVMAPLAVPPVRPTNTPEIPFKFVRHKLHLLIILLPEAFLARNCLILLLLHLELRLHSSFPSCFPLKKLLLACNPLGVARIRRLMSWTMILSLTFRTGFPSHFGNCLLQAYLLKHTLRFWPKTVWT